MQKFGLGCPLGFLVNKPQRNKTIVLDLNYDCYVEIFSYLTALEDKLNFARAHPIFLDVLIRESSQRFAKINMRMLHSIYDWGYLLPLVGAGVVECGIRHGRWDNAMTLPFLTLLRENCPHLQHLHLIFVDSVPNCPAINEEVNILEQVQHTGLKCLSLTDAKASTVLQLRKFPQLESLHIDGFDVELTDDGFTKQLKALPNLRNFYLRFATRRPYPLGQRCLCPLVEHLSLENFETTLPDIGDFPKLKSLHLRWRHFTHVNNNLFQMLAKRYADGLQRLQLSKVLPHQAEYIVSLSKLKMLACPMWPSESLDRLLQLQQLECLTLQCTSLNVRLIQLLDVVLGCEELQHLTLGVNWPEHELEDFISAAQEKLPTARTTLLLTLEFPKSKELQSLLRARIKHPSLRLDWRRQPCHWCKPDGHTKQELFLD